MGILQSLEFVPGVKWFESGMHDALFQHSVFGAIVFLIVSNTGVYKFVKETLFSVTGFKADGNTLQFIHAVVFAVIMYFGSMYLFAPLMVEGHPSTESSAQHHQDEIDQEKMTTDALKHSGKVIKDIVGGIAVFALVLVFPWKFTFEIIGKGLVAIGKGLVAMVNFFVGLLT